MPTFEVANRYSEIAPIVVTSPATRCGTTLVQRLLSASDNGFVYGEEVGYQIRTVITWFAGLVRQYEQSGERMDKEFAQALTGKLRDWRPGLTAPTTVMQRAWVEIFYQLPLTLSDYSRSIGRPAWGYKVPGLTRDMLRVTLSMMPRAKVIYVFRNLYDVLKSAKARKFVTSDKSVTQFCADWANNMREVSGLAQDERVLFLKYEDLVENRDECVHLLEAFTGASHLDPHVFDLKINTFAGEEAAGHSPDQYIRPAHLTARDRAAVASQGGPVLQHFYGAEAAAA